MIDPRAIVDPSARIADDVEIGPFSIIGADVEIGEGTVVGPHVIIRGPTKIGKHNKKRYNRRPHDQKPTKQDDVNQLDCCGSKLKGLESSAKHYDQVQSTIGQS